MQSPPCEVVLKHDLSFAMPCEMKTDEKIFLLSLLISISRFLCILYREEAAEKPKFVGPPREKPNFTLDKREINR